MISLAKYHKTIILIFLLFYAIGIPSCGSLDIAHGFPITYFTQETNLWKDSVKIPYVFILFEKEANLIFFLIDIAFAIGIFFLIKKLEKQENYEKSIHPFLVGVSIYAIVYTISLFLFLIGLQINIGSEIYDQDFMTQDPFLSGLAEVFQGPYLIIMTLLTPLMISLYSGTSFLFESLNLYSDTAHFIYLTILLFILLLIILSLAGLISKLIIHLKNKEGDNEEGTRFLR